MVVALQLATTAPSFCSISRPSAAWGIRSSAIAEAGKPERDWLLAVMLAERGVRADTGMLSRFFIGEGISFKKKACCPPNRISVTSPVDG